jgi:poly(3-hydroxybutyrate) depolymerase
MQRSRMSAKSLFLASGAIGEATRAWRRPEIGLATTMVADRRVVVREETLAARPFCRLLHFERDAVRHDPAVLVVAPLSGHFSVLLRDLLSAFLPEHDVYLIDWTDAREVPVADGLFGIAEYVAYVIDFVRALERDIHLVALCQSAMPTLAATALLASSGESAPPRSLTLISGMLDARINPTRIDRVAVSRMPGWFARNAIDAVPPPSQGQGRLVYAARMQRAGLLAYLARHIATGGELFDKVLDDDGEDAAHHPFLDQFLSVMDLPAEFFLDTIRLVFRAFALPRGELTWRGVRVEPLAIRHTGLMTIEGELDDVSSPGQTRVAHKLCRNISQENRAHFVQRAVGHFGTFHGRAWRREIMPRIQAFIRGL